MFDSELKEKKLTRYTTKDDLHNALFRAFRGIKTCLTSDLVGNIVGDVKVRNILITDQEDPDDQQKQVGIATIEDRVHNGIESYSITGLAFNHYINKVGSMNVLFARQPDEIHNTVIDYLSESPEVAAKFKANLSRFNLAGSEFTFLINLSKHFNNISFGFLEDAKQDPHRMIYCDKVPIGVLFSGSHYRGLLYDHKVEKVVSRRVSFRASSCSHVVKYVKVGELSEVMLTVFNPHVERFSPDTSTILTAFGSSKSTSISVKARDLPDSEEMYIPLGVGLESHLRHLGRSNKKYTGLAYNPFEKKVGKMVVTTERLYSSNSSKYDFKSRVEYMPDSQQYHHAFLAAVGNFPLSVSSFMCTSIADAFVNPAIGPKRHRGKFTVLRSVYSDGVEIGSYLENTATGDSNYRGLFKEDMDLELPHYVNTIFYLSKG